MDVVEPKDMPESNVSEAPEKEAETSIDLDPQTKVITIQINLNKGPVNAYGTCQLAMEYCCRYFTTLEIQMKKLRQESMAENQAKTQAEKSKIDGALKKMGLVMPGDKK